MRRIKNTRKKGKRSIKRKYRKQKGGQSPNYSDYTICFTNLYQNGDIYISSQFIIDIKNKLKNDIKYYINFSGNNKINPENFEYLNIPLLDITTNNQYNTDKFIVINNDTKEIIVNTWVGVFNNFVGEHDVYLPFYYNQFKEIYNLLNIQIENIEFYIPSFNQALFIKYNNNLQIIKNIYDKIPKKKILICNGHNHSYNNGFDPRIIKLCIDNNYFVKVTNESSIGDPNILEIYKKNLEEFSSVSDDYTNIMNKDNLLYINNIFASQSHIIIGLASGLFITTYSKETLDKKFIMISSHTHIVYEKFNSTWITNGNTDALINEIGNIIKS